MAASKYVFTFTWDKIALQNPMSFDFMICQPAIKYCVFTVPD